MKRCMDSENLHRRLKKIIGQVKAIDRMVDEDVPCEDVLAQLNAAKSALNKCGQVVLEGHINHCIKDAIEKGDEEGGDQEFHKGDRTLCEYAVGFDELYLSEHIREIRFLKGGIIISGNRDICPIFGTDLSLGKLFHMV